MCVNSFSFIHSGVLLSSIGRLYLMHFLTNVCFTLVLADEIERILLYCGGGFDL